MVAPIKTTLAQKIMKRLYIVKHSRFLQVYAMKISTLNKASSPLRISITISSFFITKKDFGVAIISMENASVFVSK